MSSLVVVEFRFKKCIRDGLDNSHECERRNGCPYDKFATVDEYGDTTKCPFLFPCGEVYKGYHVTSDFHFFESSERLFFGNKNSEYYEESEVLSVTIDGGRIFEQEMKITTDKRIAEYKSYLDKKLKGDSEDEK